MTYSSVVSREIEVTFYLWVVCLGNQRSESDSIVLRTMAVALLLSFTLKVLCR